MEHLVPVFHATTSPIAGGSCPLLPLPVSGIKVYQDWIVARTGMGSRRRFGRPDQREGEEAMFGSKGPGGRDVYARRRLLAVLAVLVLLALLVPRACQALLGSNEGAGQGEGQKSGAAGKAAGAGAEDDAGDADTGNADTGNAEKSDTQAKQSTKEGTSDRGAPFVEDKPGAGGRSGEAGEEAAPDLGVMVANLAVIDGSEEFASSEDQGAAESAPESSETGSEQPISEVQFALAASPAPTQQPSSEPETQRSSFEPEPAPARRPEPEAAAPAAEPAPVPLGEQIRDRADQRVTAALAEPAALEEVGAPQTAVEPVAPVAAEPVAAAPAPAAPAPAAPAPVVPAPAVPAPAVPAPVVPAPAVPAPAVPAPAAPVAADPTFAPAPAGGALNGAPTVPAARTNLPAGPRLAAVGPRRTPGPDAF
jgi:hypothetical protein